MKKLIIFITFILLLTSSVVFSGWFSSDKEKHHQRLGKLLESERKKLPRMIDKHTRYDTVYLRNDNLTAKHTLSDTLVKMERNKLRKYLDDLIVNNYCTDPSMKIFRKYNTNFIIRYFSNAGNFLFESKASNKNC